MLGKLLKYEYRATFKLYLVLYAIVLALSGIVRLLTSFDMGHNVIISTLTIMFTVTVVLALAGLYFVTLIFVMFRFYKHLFSDEGYLTFTLPVTPFKIILSKIIVGMTWVIGCFAVLAGAVAIMLYGSETLDNIKIIWNMFGSSIFDMLFEGEILQVIYYIMNTVISVFSTVCFIYLAVAFGQVMMPRHKVAGSILSYLIISVATSIISAIFSILFYTIVGYDLASTELPQSYYLLSTILSLGLSIVSVVLVNNICKKHLNLS